jgi:tetratricopeptide (TPR) repeat protein
MQAAESALQAGVRVNPADPAPRQALLRFLIAQKRLDEAFVLTDASLQFAPKDVNLLVDRGLLAQGRGHPDQAVESWKRALAIDPGHASAHLYLADVLDREGQPLESAAHYTKFLEVIARQTSRPTNRPAPQQVIAVILRLADCQTRASETAQAIQSYQLARKLSVQTQQSQLESVAAVNEAELQAKSGKLADALHLYQRALQLDESVGDSTAYAQDWLAYGKFLDDSGFPARLAYSCFVKSERLKDPLPNPEQQQLRADAAKLAARRAGSEAAAVRRNLDLSVRQALALTVE